MNKRLCVLLMLVVMVKAVANSQPMMVEQLTTPVGTRLADNIIQRYQPTINVMTHHGWDHSNSIILHGIEKIYLKTQNENYLTYIKKYADDYINDDGSITGLLTTLDGIHPGVLCLFLYQETGNEKYRLAAKMMRDHLLGTKTKSSVFHKTPDGGFGHKNNKKYHHVMSVDGLYMTSPFLIRYGILFNEPEVIDMAIKQILLISERSFNLKANLPFHAWHYDKTNDWADPVTGTSSQFWSRAAGWYSMALVDVLEFLPKKHLKYPIILDLYKQLAQGIKNTQNPKDGLWYQVLDVYDRPDNYPEISGSAMMVYSIKKAINLNILTSEDLIFAEKGWLSIQSYIKTYSDGGLQIRSVAPGMSTQVSYEDYVAIRPVNVPTTKQKKQHAHGYMGVLMAASVMESYEIFH